MLSWVTAPFLLLFVCAIGFKLDDYFQKRKRIEKEVDMLIALKDMEKEMRERGINKDTINKMRWFF